jgi:hypothetical protein
MFDSSYKWAKEKMSTIANMDELDGWLQALVPILLAAQYVENSDNGKTIAVESTISYLRYLDGINKPLVFRRLPPFRRLSLFVGCAAYYGCKYDYPELVRTLVSLNDILGELEVPPRDLLRILKGYIDGDLTTHSPGDSGGR